MAVAHVPLWAVCMLRVALATVYFQEEFLDGGEEATPVVVEWGRKPIAGVTSGPRPSPRDWWWWSLKASKPQASLSFPPPNTPFMT